MVRGEPGPNRIHSRGDGLNAGAQGSLKGDPDGITRHIADTALPRSTTQTCGAIPAGEVPNNTYGYGSVRAVVPPPTACTRIFNDGFESGNTSGWSAALP